MIGSVYKKYKNYYPQVFLEECEYFVKEKKTSTFITDGIENSSDDSDRENCDEENSNEEILNILNIKYRNLNIEKLQVPS